MKTIKRHLAAILCVIMLLTAAPLSGFTKISLSEINLSDLLAPNANAASSGNYNYSVVNGEAVITRVSQLIKGDITVPSVLGKYPVTSIGEDAFSECEYITSLVIPDSVDYIGEGAFSGCKKLKSIKLSNKISFISDRVFGLCISLEHIVIPDSVTYINYWSFTGCKALKSIVLPCALKSIGLDAFSLCSSLSDVYYKGTKNEWKSIKIHESNTYLLNAKIHCNYSQSKPIDPIDIFDRNTYVADIWSANRKDKISNTPENIYIDHMFKDKGEMSKRYYEALQEDKVFIGAMKTWDGINYLFDPATGYIKRHLDIEELYQIILGDMIHFIATDAMYSENRENKTLETAKNVKDIMNAVFGAWQEDFVIKNYAQLAQNKKSGDSQWKAYFSDVFDVFKKSGKVVESVETVLDFAGELLDVAETIDDFCRLLATYIEAMQLTDDMWAAIDKMKNVSTSSTVKNVLSKLQYSSMDKKLSKAIISAGLEATEDTAVIILDVLLEPIYNKIPIYREVRLAHKGLKTVYQLVFGTDDIVNAYYTLKATSEICDAAKAAALSLENEYLSKQDSASAGKYIAAVELMVSAINIDLDSLAKTMYIAFRKTGMGKNYTAVSPFLSYLGLQEEDIYDEFYRDNQALKETTNMLFRYLEASWALYTPYLETDYPEFYSMYATKAAKECVDLKPRILNTYLNNNGAIEIRLTRNMFIDNFADGYYVKEITAGKTETYTFKMSDLKKTGNRIVLECFNKNTVSLFPKTYKVCCYIGKLKDGVFSKEQTTEIRSPLITPELELDNVRSLMHSSSFFGELGFKINDRTSSKYKQMKYHIYRSYDNGEFIKIATINKEEEFFDTVTQYIDTTIDYSGKYKTVTYKVKSEKYFTSNGGFSVYSELSDGLLFVLTDPLFTKGSVKSTKTVTNSGDIKNGISVSWEKISGATSYEIYRKESYAEDFELIATVENENMYEDYIVSSGTEYQYYVLACAKNKDTGNKTAYVGGSESGSLIFYEPLLAGDVDRNGSITAADARFVLRASVKLENPSDRQKVIADVDGNKTVTASDARTILRTSVGLEKAVYITEKDDSDNIQKTLEATASDKEKLRNMIYYHTMDYNYKNDSIEKVIEYVLAHGDQNKVLKESVYVDFCNPTDKSFKPDPKGLFNGGYKRYSATAVEWICENVFYKKFDSKASSAEFYVQGDYIYSAPVVSGNQPAETIIDSMTRLNDGKYEVVFSFRYEGEKEIICRKKVIAELVEINGVRCWTFYQIELVKKETEAPAYKMPSTKAEICKFYADSVNYENEKDSSCTEKMWMDLGKIDMGNNTLNSLVSSIAGSYITSKEDAEAEEYDFFAISNWELEDLSAVKSASCTEYGDNYKITIIMNGEKGTDEDNSMLYGVTHLYYSNDDMDYYLSDDTVAAVLKGKTDACFEFNEVKIEAIITKEGKLLSVTHISDVDIVINSATITVYPVKDKRINVITYDECYNIK